MRQKRFFEHKHLRAMALASEFTARRKFYLGENSPEIKQKIHFLVELLQKVFYFAFF